MFSLINYSEKGFSAFWGLQVSQRHSRPVGKRSSSESSNMHKRESILSQFYPRGRKDASSNRDHGSANELSPQVSSSSTRSNASSRSIQSSSRSNATSKTSSKQTTPAPKPKQEDAVSFRIRLETPPAIMYGTTQESAGALISGICDVDLTNLRKGPEGQNSVELVEVSMSIVQVIKSSVPPQVAKKLPKGTEQHNILATWDILKHPHFLEYANFAYPFSHLLPGTLPPTSSTPLFSIEYFINASATTRDNRRSQASLPLKIGRSVVGVTEKTSVRIFPPTSLSLSMVLPTALFPNSHVHAEMRMEGLVTPNPPGSTVKFKRWQLKRINWRVDEFIKVKYGEGTDEEYEHKHTLGFGVHKSGWKHDYNLQNGVVELDCSEFCPGVLSKANKDLQDPVAGLSVSHQLICELLIAEEVVSSPSSKQGVLSGGARVLRMQFGFPVVDRPGLGISWEDEVPPMYADIPLSPPQYNEVADLPSLEEFRTNSLVFSPMLISKMSPTLRHLSPSMRGFEHMNSPLLSSNIGGSHQSPTIQPIAPLSSIPPGSNLNGSTSNSSNLRPTLSRGSTSTSPFFGQADSLQPTRSAPPLASLTSLSLSGNASGSNSRPTVPTTTGSDQTESAAQIRPPSPVHPR